MTVEDKTKTDNYIPDEYGSDIPTMHSPTKRPKTTHNAPPLAEQKQLEAVRIITAKQFSLHTSYNDICRDLYRVHGQILDAQKNMYAFLEEIRRLLEEVEEVDRLLKALTLTNKPSAEHTAELVIKHYETGYSTDVNNAIDKFFNYNINDK